MVFKKETDKETEMHKADIESKGSYYTIKNYSPREISRKRNENKLGDTKMQRGSDTFNPSCYERDR